MDTGVTERISSGEKQYVIGRKGSGKTALFKEAKIHGVEIIRVDFDDYAWEVHKAIKQMGVPAENAYTASWIFTFLVAACRVWRKSPKQNVREAANKIHLKIYGADEGGVLDMLLDRAKRMRKLELPNIGELGGLGGIELEAMTPGERLAQTASAWNKYLYDLADSVFAAHPVSIFVDRLDDGWDASDQMTRRRAFSTK